MAIHLGEKMVLSLWAITRMAKSLDGLIIRAMAVLSNQIIIQMTHYINPRITYPD
jgi:hypothetical protein